MGGDVDYLNPQYVGDNLVDHPPLKPKPGRSMPFPLAGQGFVVETLDGPQTLRSGKSGNVLPFLVTLQNLYRNGARKLLVDTTVFFDLPHAILWIYQ